MKRLIKLSSLALCAGLFIYFVCVLATGLVAGRYLRDIDSVAKQMIPTKAADIKESLKVTYVKENYSFFNEKGSVKVSVGDFIGSFPITIKYGFLNAEVDVNTEILNHFCYALSKRIPGLFFKYESVKSKLNASIGAFSGAFIDAGVEAQYSDNKNNFTAKSSLRVSIFENVINNFDISNFYSDYISVDKLQSESSQQGLKKLKVFGYSNIEIKGVKYDDFYIENILANCQAVNSNDESFDLNVNIRVSSLDDYIKDFETQLLIKKFSYDEINKYIDTENKTDIKHPFESVDRIEITSINASLLKKFNRFVGIFRKTPLVVNGNGFIEVDNDNPYYISNAKLLLRTNDATGALLYFKKNNKSSECEIEFNNNRLSVNGYRL